MSTRSTSSNQAIVVGAGSIGVRHKEILEDLGFKVGGVSRRRNAGEFKTVGEAVKSSNPSYVVLATATERHLESLVDLIASGYTGRVLLEKPILDRSGPLPNLPFESIAIGYNMRFHPAVRSLRDALSDQQVLSAQLRYGEYLPNWRPGRDYRQTVTAGVGGGVLLELSHELDLVNWLLGPASVLYGRSLRTGSLEMEREDLAIGVLGLPGGGLVSIELNCLDRVQNRTFVVTTSDHFFQLDLIAGSLTVDGEVISSGPVERNDTFSAMHRAVLQSKPGPCSVPEAMAVLKLTETLRSN